MKRLKKLLVLTLAGAALALMPFTASAQTSTVTTNLDFSSTNWIAIPYVAYDVQKKDYGYGAAVLYSVTKNFWAGVRVQRLGDKTVTAGVQGQLQAPVVALGRTIWPFLETSVGLGKDALYGNAGAGVYVPIYGHAWKRVRFDVGVIGDYEHYVEGNANGEQVNAGALLHVSF